MRRWAGSPPKQGRGGDNWRLPLGRLIPFGLFCRRSLRVGHHGPPHSADSMAPSMATVRVGAQGRRAVDRSRKPGGLPDGMADGDSSDGGWQWFSNGRPSAHYANRSGANREIDVAGTSGQGISSPRNDDRQARRKAGCRSGPPLPRPEEDGVGKVPRGEGLHRGPGMARYFCRNWSPKRKNL